MSAVAIWKVPLPEPYRPTGVVSVPVPGGDVVRILSVGTDLSGVAVAWVAVNVTADRDGSFKCWVAGTGDEVPRWLLGHFVGSLTYVDRVNAGFIAHVFAHPTALGPGRIEWADAPDWTAYGDDLLGVGR